VDIHIFTSEGLYSKSFLEFYNHNFSLKDEIFVFRSQHDLKYSYPQNVNKRILYVKNAPEFLFILMRQLLKSNKIYIHYLPVGPSLFFWYIFQFLLKKTTWILWGSDLYFYKLKEKNLRSTSYEFLRKRIIKKIPTIACFVKGDYEIAKEVYKTNANYKPILYPIPTNFELLEHIKRSEVQEKIILLGNSADPSNGHIEIIEVLSKYKDENFKIICPLSYGNINGYAEKVINKGKEFFSDKFIILEKLLNENEYSNLLASVSVAIMNHNRQQGLGNVLSLLYLGKKVYLKKETTAFKYFSNLRIEIFSTENINNESFESLLSFDENIKRKNYEIVKKEFGLERYLYLWKNLLNK
jgi:dTDP-N-acetylfucosamine:lipid II N-acetylfucosaminyltransferase